MRRRRRRDRVAAARAPQRDDTYDDESDEETTRQKKRKAVDGVDFQVVAAEAEPPTDSDSDAEGYGYDSEVDELSDDTRARILALGKKMIRKKDREELIEDAYNRYAFDDDDVPDWFAEDERRFMKPIPQYTAAELAEAKAQLAAVNTRPIKKVAEAKWRKKKRAEAKISQARVRASAIIEQDDVPDVSKAKEIERVFAKARRATSGAIKKPRKVVVARKYHRGNAGGPSVDKRQLADARGERAAARRGGKGGKGGKAKAAAAAAAVAASGDRPSRPRAPCNNDSFLRSFASSHARLARSHRRYRADSSRGVDFKDFSSCRRDNLHSRASRAPGPTRDTARRRRRVDDASRRAPRARNAPRALVDAEIVVERVESRRPPARDRWKTRRPRRRRRRCASATATPTPPVARRFEAKRRWMITSYCDRSVRDRSGRCFRRGSGTADARAR